jgi:hypothetical protein
MSLKRALEQLAFGPCHHMEELLMHPEQVHYWQGLVAGRRMNWEEVFAGYNSQVDWPGAHVWRDLAAAYPQAKVIHTLRPEEDWWRSFSQTIAALLTSDQQMPPPPHIQGVMHVATDEKRCGRAGRESRLEISRSKIDCDTARPSALAALRLNSYLIGSRIRRLHRFSPPESDRGCTARQEAQNASVESVGSGGTFRPGLEGVEGETA